VTSPLQSAVNGMTGALLSASGVPVTYTRGDDSVALTAGVGRSEYENADLQGIVAVGATRDYLIRAADLRLGGVVVEPERGDAIAETIGSTVYTWEVMPLGAEPPFRPCDPGRTLLRIHTQLVETEG